MATQLSYYEILEVKQDASQEEIRKAYRRVLFNFVTAETGVAGSSRRKRTPTKIHRIARQLRNGTSRSARRSPYWAIRTRANATTIGREAAAQELAVSTLRPSTATSRSPRRTTSSARSSANAVRSAMLPRASASDSAVDSLDLVDSVDSVDSRTLASVSAAFPDRSMRTPTARTTRAAADALAVASLVDLKCARLFWRLPTPQFALNRTCLRMILEAALAATAHSSARLRSPALAVRQLPLNCP